MRLGLVGYGTGGKNFHAPFIEAAEGVDLVGIVARSKDKIAAARADFPNLPIYESLTSMIASTELDAVTITTPPHTRHGLVMEAIDAGLHVVADKPFAPNAAIAQEMADAASKSGVLMSVFHNRRFDTDIVTLNKTIQSGKLGKLWRLQSRFDLNDAATLEVGPEGGLLRDLGSHVVDQAIFLLGPVKSVYANMDDLELPEGRTNVSFSITMNHVSGAHSHVSASKINYIEAKELIVYAENGSYFSQATDVQAQDIFAGRRPVENLSTWGFQGRDNWATLNTPTGSERVPSEQGRYHDYYTQFAKAVEHGMSLPVTANEAIQVLKVLDAALLSASNNQVIELGSS
ncbi:MAG: Gfo/Idh/MocA family oxidoreductase [Pseudomonadota bacterium]|nr:Gfo/Idh/MocA family oxidoreductase [Pseudomonadota bacterium]MEC8484886.1 Gfo/Idh/MocA family oxidoreductase [Pseudomonadota bacterium]